MPTSLHTNEDCMDLMARYPDKYFDLAVVDPPYGIGEDGKKTKSRDVVRYDPRNGARINCRAKSYKLGGWDNSPPDQNYFNELFRVSKVVFVWGENYINFNQKITSSGRIIWNKFTGESDFSDCEICWTNAIKSVRMFNFMWAGFKQGKSMSQGHINQGNKALCEKRMHPTQKPVVLYDWILKKYAKPGQIILDTHVGSGSSRIAAHRAGLDFVGCELDPDYFAASEKRFKNYLAQLPIEWRKEPA